MLHTWDAKFHIFVNCRNSGRCFQTKFSQKQSQLKAAYIKF
jgi:hypothetical protein